MALTLEYHGIHWIYPVHISFHGVSPTQPRLSGVSPRRKSVGEKNLRSRRASRGEIVSNYASLWGAVEVRKLEKP